MRWPRTRAGSLECQPGRQGQARRPALLPSVTEGGLPEPKVRYSTCFTPVAATPQQARTAAPSSKVPTTPRRLHGSFFLCIQWFHAHGPCASTQIRCRWNVMVRKPARCTLSPELPLPWCFCCPGSPLAAPAPDQTPPSPPKLPIAPCCPQRMALPETRRPGMPAATGRRRPPQRSDGFGGRTTTGGTAGRRRGRSC